MKLLKNKNGFTLIELLAVIVVLAIIMVIATTQINNTIKKSRADSFLNTAKMVKKNADLACAQYGASLTEDDIKNATDYDPDEYSITWTSGTITLAPQDGSKFDGVDFADYLCDGEEASCETDGVNVNASNMTIGFSCSDSELSS